MRKLKMEELNRLSVDAFKQIDKIPFVIILDSIRSLHNVGAVFRTSDAFSLEGIYLCGITAQPPHRDIHKTALGATESVAWEYHKNALYAIEKLKGNGYKIIAVEQTTNSIMLNEFSISKNEKHALVFGNEVNGIDDEVLKVVDTCIEIPQYGTKHSLNIAVSVGVVVWDLFVKLGI